MKNELYEIHLNLPYCCKRGVRFRMLTAPEVNELSNQAAQNLKAALGPGETPTPMAQRNETLRLGVRAMVVAVTEPVDKLEGAAWHELTAMDTEMPSSQYFFDKLFPYARDDQLLSAQYSDFHELKQQELEEIRGKVSMVLKD